VNTEQRSTTEKDPTRERALLRERTGVLDGEEKKIQRAKKMKKPLDTAGLVRDFRTNHEPGGKPRSSVDRLR